jgi:hypothetical protein
MDEGEISEDAKLIPAYRTILRHHEIDKCPYAQCGKSPKPLECHFGIDISGVFSRKQSTGQNPVRA